MNNISNPKELLTAEIAPGKGGNRIERGIINRPPYTGQRIHPNSIEAFRDLDIPVRWRAVFETYMRLYPKYLTDRQVLYHMTGSYSGDMNKVRPRITEMILEKTIPLWETGHTKCRITEKRVRVVGLAAILPEPCKIPEPIGDLTPPVEDELHRLYTVVQPGQQTLELTGGPTTLEVRE